MSEHTSLISRAQGRLCYAWPLLRRASEKMWLPEDWMWGEGGQEEANEGWRGGRFPVKEQKVAKEKPITT